MNQILYVDRSKKGNSLEINSIIKIFVIIITIFGIILISKGIYGIVNNSKNSIVGAEPIVTVKEVGEKLQISIVHDKAIDKIVYSWNNSEENILQARGQSQLIETIDLPIGNNILNLKIIDTNKKIVTYSKEYYREDKDITSPEIELVVEGSKVKIVAKDETELSYITYHWNDEEDTKVEAREDSKKQIEEKISILKGENKLTIVAVDSSGNKASKEQIYKGAKKPTIETNQNNNELAIKITDEENIKKIEININGEFFSTDPENVGDSLNMKEVQLTQPLQQGENTITITAYNVSGLSEQVTKQITI